MVTWQPDSAYRPPSVSARGWLRIAWRLPVLAVLLFGGLAILVLSRAVERVFTGERRPVTQYIPHWCCGTALRIVGLRFEARGCPMKEPGAQVANHASWLDIFALYRRDRVYFVSKAEVAGWAGIGVLSRAAGTLFITRDPRHAADQRRQFETRLRLGHRLVFFPEGTSTDGQRVLPFKSTLFAAFYDIETDLWIQPVTVRYQAPDGADPRFYAWFGDQDFVPHFLAMLGAPRHGCAVVHYHAPMRVGDYASRKALAKAAEDQVRAAL